MNQFAYAKVESMFYISLSLKLFYPFLPYTDTGALVV